MTDAEELSAEIGLANRRSLPHKPAEIGLVIATSPAVGFMDALNTRLTSYGYPRVSFGEALAAFDAALEKGVLEVVSGRKVLASSVRS